VTELYVTGLIAVVVLGYLGSLLINPWVKCSRCGGKSRVRGGLFNYAHHDCPKCKGSGRQVRLGRRIIFGPPK
jgi:DnaJ-class molecular chaperone